MKKTWIYILIGALAIILALSGMKNGIVKFAIEKGVKQVTGLKLSIGELSVGIATTRIDIKNLKLHNPRGFEDKLMLDMPEIYVDYDLPAFFRGKIHLKDMKIDMKEFIVEKNTRGDLNLDSLKMTKKEEAPEKKKEAKPMEMQIDSLDLKVGKVLYKDYSQGGKPAVQEFDVNIHENYTNITDLKSLISLIMSKALMKTTISKLTNFELNKLTDSISSQLINGSKLLSSGGKAAGAVGAALGGAVKKLEASLFSGEEK